MKTVNFGSITYPATPPPNAATDIFEHSDSVGRLGRLYVQVEYSVTNTTVLTPYFSIGDGVWVPIRASAVGNVQIALAESDTKAALLITDLMPGTRFRFGLTGSIVEDDTINVIIST